MKPDYGIDAPGLVRTFFLVGVASGGIAALCFAMSDVWWVWALGFAASIMAAYSLFMGCMMIFESRVVKLRDRERILNLVDWRGDEAVLDVGCGRGLMMVGAARRVPNGYATGVDIWSDCDQSDNGADSARANAAIEGVADRIRVETADMCEMPFGDHSFDVIVSAWAVHNVALSDDRRRALAEMVRVLKPGGTILLTDIEKYDEYAAELAGFSGGMTDLIILSPAAHRFRMAVSFGSFAPATVRFHAKAA